MDHSVSPCFFVISLLFLYCFFLFLLHSCTIGLSKSLCLRRDHLASGRYFHQSPTIIYAQLNLLFILFTLPFMHFLPFITIDFPIYLIALCFLTPDWLSSSLTSHYHSFVFEEFTFSGKISYFHNAKSILKVVVIHCLNGWINPFKYWSSRC